MRDIAQGAVSSLVDDLRRGVTAGEAFKKVLDDIAGKLIDMAMNSLFDDLFKKGGSGGGIMDFVSSLLGPARAGGGPVRAGALTPVGERGPELFVPEVNGRIIPNHKLAGVMSGRGGGGVTVNNFGAPEDVSVTRDAHGNTTVDVLAQVKADIGRDMLRGQGAIGQAARASGVQKPLKG